jgi:hypothetical protein
MKWIHKDVLMIVLPTCVTGLAAMQLVHLPQSRMGLLGVFSVIGLILLVVAALGSSMLRPAIFQLLKAQFIKDRQ